VELDRQIAHILRQHGEIDPVPVIGGYVVESRADGGVNVYWRAPGALQLRFMRGRA
jgi:hypothetical protein